MEELLIHGIGWFFKKTYYFIRYRDRVVRAQKEKAFSERSNGVWTETFAALLIILFVVFLIGLTTRIVYDLIHHNTIH